MRDMDQQQPALAFAGQEMREIFSEDMKFRLWRRLWLVLAESQSELGLDISAAQLAELRGHLDDINYGIVAIKQRELGGEVRAHLYALGMQCPKARPILHLGVSEAYLTENSALLRLRAALLRIRCLLLNAVAALADFAERYQRLPCLCSRGAETASATTLGKRAALWINDLMLDLRQIEFQLDSLRLLGCRGTAGNNAALAALFAGGCAQVRQMEQSIAEKLGFAGCYQVSGQAYSRKVDAQALAALGNIAASAAKFAADLRLLAERRELAEAEPPPAPEQDGEALSGRVAVLARYIMAQAQPALAEAAAQSLEAAPAAAEPGQGLAAAFIAADAMLRLYIYSVEGCRALPEGIAARLAEELPFIALGEIFRQCLAQGGDKQQLQQALLEHARAASAKRRDQGGRNDLLQRIAGDARFALDSDQLRQAVKDCNYTGCAAEQTADFLARTVDPLLTENQSLLSLELKIGV